MGTVLKKLTKKNITWTLQVLQKRLEKMVTFTSEKILMNKTVFQNIYKIGTSSEYILKKLAKRLLLNGNYS